jgi:EmrB/QacA subfamily drug resistance transporter
MKAMQMTARKPWTALVLLAAIEFMILLDASIVNIALPSIQTSLHFSEADLGWVQNLYQLIFGSLLLFGGRAADLFGRRKLYLLGLSVFTLSSLLAGVAPTAAVLLLARALQGLGAAVVIPAEPSLLATIFTDPKERNRAFGIWSALGAAGGAFGVVLGGVLTQVLGWPSIFLINVPIGAVVLLISSRFVPESREEGERKALDVPGILTVTPALLLLAYGPVLAQTQGFGLSTMGVFVLVVVLLRAFLGIEARSSAPLVPLRLFRLRDLNGANLASFLIGASHAPMFYFLSLYLQQVLFYHTFTAGLAILPIAGLSIVIAFLGLAKALGRLGFKGVLAGGMVLLAVGLVLLARAPLPNTYLLDVLPASLIVALGLPAVFAASNIAAVTAVEQADTGLASGLVNTTQRIGSGVGIALLSVLFAARVPAHPTPSSLVPGFQVAFLGAAFFAALGAVLTLLIIRGKRGETSASQQARQKVPSGQFKILAGVGAKPSDSEKQSHE